MVTNNTVISEGDNWTFQSAVTFIESVSVGTASAPEDIILNGISLLNISVSSAEWNAVQTLFADNSGNWESAYAMVCANSASWEESTDISLLSAQIDNNTGNISGLTTLSADWESTYTTVQANSASWGSLSGWSLHPAITTVEIADQPIEAVQYIDFSTTTAIVSAIASQEGRMYWGDDDGTLNLGMPGGDVTLQIGQEQIIRVQNDGVANITNGQAVYITGTQGNRPKVAVASNESELLSHAVIGLATEDLDVSGGERIGYVTTFGMVRDIDTSHLPVGETVFLGTSGALISAAPVSPNHEVVIGYCLNSHATNGIVYVELDLGGALSDLHDAKITLPQNDDVLLYNSVSSIWMNSNESTNWNSTYTTVCANSASWDSNDASESWVQTNFVNLTGDIMTGALYVNNVAASLDGGLAYNGYGLYTNYNLYTQCLDTDYSSKTVYVREGGGGTFSIDLDVTGGIYIAGEGKVNYAAVSGIQIVNYQTMNSFVATATAGIPTDTPNLSSVLAEGNDANNQGIIGLGSLAIGATALSWGSGDITQSTGNWYEIRDPNKDRWMQANSGAGVIFYNQDAAEVLKLGATSEIPSLKVGNGIWTSEGTAIGGNQIVNYQTMDSFVTAATAGLGTPPLSAVLDVNAAAGNKSITDVLNIQMHSGGVYYGGSIADASITSSIDFEGRTLESKAGSIWSMTTDATIGQQIVNYQTMQSFVTAATAGIPTGGSDVSSLSGNWESTYTTVQANSATWEAGGGGTSAEQSYIDQSGGTSDTYGVLLGSVDGANTTYTVAQSSYDSGTLAIFLNGQVQTQGSSEDWTETSPSVGTFDFVIAPLVDDEITAHYKKIAVVTGASFETDQSGGVSDTYGILAGSVNSSNTTYTVAAAKYASSSLHVYLDGQMQTQGVSSDWVETTPSAGTFDFITAPISGSEIIVTYQPLLAAAGNADTVDGFHASSSATANRLITLDSNADLNLGDNDILNIQNITNNTQDQDFFLQTNAGGSMVSAIQVHGDTGALSFANQSMATVYLSANQTITSGGTQLVNMNTAMFDNLGEFDPVTHLFTVTIAGRYLITSVMGMLSLTDQKAMLNIISINGGNTYIVQTSSAVTGVHAATNIVIVDLDVGDTIGFIILQGDTISQDLIGGTTRTYASILKVG